MDIRNNTFSNSHHFAQKGLIFDGNVTFHNRNLLIGRNGAGKTRFLKALEQYYKDSNPNASVLTLYFPESHSNREEISNKNLYDAIYEKDVLCYQDFLQLASKDWLALIDDIYSGMSLRAKKSAQRMQADFEQLNKYFLIFFDSELCPKEGNSKIHMVKHINGTDRKVPVEQAIKEFSPGELMLFYLSILVFYLDHLSDISIVLIMDEPEIHLHPKALIALMEMLTKSNAISQLWVASHSLFIMPLFPFEQIVHFDRNHICPLNRNTYKRIYDDLIGLENIDVYELLKSVENWSYYQFVVENFFLPTSKYSAKKDDEQVQKFISYLDSVRNDRPIKVLDYGAGKYRLWECLKQAIPDRENREKLLIYEAFEPYPSVNIPEGIDAYSDESELKCNHYDVVVLMNVLHEIDPTQWVQTFRLISNVLSDDGVMVFLEVHTLTNGEQPYGQAGFLLLQDPQVKKLFSQASIVRWQDTKQEKSNCWIVSKSSLQTVTQSKIQKTISCLESYCESLLKKLDDERIALAHDANPQDVAKIKMAGRKYAFLSQQYINAHFANIRLNKLSQKTTTTQATPSGSEKPAFPGMEI